MVPGENERCPPCRRTETNQLKVPKEADSAFLEGKEMISEKDRAAPCTTVKVEARR